MEAEVIKIPLVPVTRPDGRVYRPRKIRCVDGDQGWGDPLFVIVLGTHDIEAARKLAEDRAAWIDPEITLKGGRAGWYRVTGDRDEARGAAGVMFEEHV